jgi:hypothetical protein
MMADILEFKRPKPLKGFIPDDINDPICEDCRPDGRGGYTCKGGACAGMVAAVFNATIGDPA